MLLYGCENWALERKDKKKVETAQMRFLTKVAPDEIRNQTMREEMDRNHL
mgnify:CR=1 FL=1